MLRNEVYKMSVIPKIISLFLTFMKIGLLKETKAVPEFVADDLLSDCETIRQTLEPIMEEYRGEYDDMPDDEFYDWLNEVFGDEEGQDEDFDL